MLPGYLAGHYQFEDCHVDLSPLAMAAGARLYHSSADGLELSAGRVLCADRPSVAFDTVSFDIGSTPARATIEGHEQALAINPFAVSWINGTALNLTCWHWAAPLSLRLSGVAQAASKWPCACINA